MNNTSGYLIYRLLKPILTSKDIIDTTFILEALPALSPISELKNSFMERGIEALNSTYHKHKEKGNAQPFSNSFYSSFRYWGRSYWKDTYF